MRSAKCLKFKSSKRNIIEMKTTMGIVKTRLSFIDLVTDPAELAYTVALLENAVEYANRIITIEDL